jgi:hypothetical protein
LQAGASLLLYETRAEKSEKAKRRRKYWLTRQNHSAYNEFDNDGAQDIVTGGMWSENRDLEASLAGL